MEPWGSFCGSAYIMGKAPKGLRRLPFFICEAVAS